MDATPDGISADDVRARQERAVAAAAAEAGRALGPTVTEPQALHDVFSVIVHLRPAPVVVRVPTGLPRTVAEHWRSGPAFHLPHVGN